MSLLPGLEEVNAEIGKRGLIALGDSWNAGV